MSSHPDFERPRAAQSRAGEHKNRRAGGPEGRWLSPSDSTVQRQPARRTSPNRFPHEHHGLRLDEETLSYQDRHRQFLARPSRHLQRNPLRHRTSPNDYVWAGCNPVSRTEGSSRSSLKVMDIITGPPVCRFVIPSFCIADTGCDSLCKSCGASCFLDWPRDRDNACHDCDCISDRSRQRVFAICGNPILRVFARGCSLWLGCRQLRACPLPFAIAR